MEWMRISEGLSWQQILFVTVAGLRGSLSLVLAQTAATMQAEKGGEAEKVGAGVQQHVTLVSTQCRMYALNLGCLSYSMG